jgi:HEAT repeat protein
MGKIMSFFAPNVWNLAKKKDIPGLIKALTYKEHKVREEAAMLLGNVGDERAFEPLIGSFHDNPKAVLKSLDQLLRTHKTFFENRLELLDNLVSFFYEDIKYIEKMDLITQRNFKHDMYRRLKEILIKVGIPCWDIIIDKLKEVISNNINFKKISDIGYYIDIIKKSKCQKAVPVLIECLNYKPIINEAYLFENIVETIGGLGHPRAALQISCCHRVINLLEEDLYNKAIVGKPFDQMGQAAMAIMVEAFRTATGKNFWQIGKALFGATDEIYLWPEQVLDGMNFYEPPVSLPLSKEDCSDFLLSSQEWNQWRNLPSETRELLLYNGESVVTPRMIGFLKDKTLPATPIPGKEYLPDRVAIAEIVGKIGGAKAVAPLADVLHDPNETDELRIASAEALSEIGLPALGPLHDFILSPPDPKEVEIKYTAVGLFGGIGKFARVAQLEEAVLKALWQIGDDSSLEVFIAYLQEKKNYTNIEFLGIHRPMATAIAGLEKIIEKKEKYHPEAVNLLWEYCNSSSQYVQKTAIKVRLNISRYTTNL